MSVNLEYKSTHPMPMPEAVDYSLIGQIYRSHGNIQRLEAEIESSRRMLELPDDWDGEGSPRYSERTFERATAFVRNHVKWLWETFGITAPVPQINPGPAGSIDIHWKQRSWELLVNVPAEEGERATFYSDDYGTLVFKGHIDTTHPNFVGLLAWLT